MKNLRALYIFKKKAPLYTTVGIPNVVKNDLKIKDVGVGIRNHDQTLLFTMDGIPTVVISGLRISKKPKVMVLRFELITRLHYSPYLEF